MTNFTSLLFSLLLLLLGTQLYAQEPLKDCDDIKVEAKSSNPTAGASNGTIELTFTEAITNYKIFWLNAGNDGTGKVEVSDGKLQNLKEGFFDILIVDKNRKLCVRQLTIILK